VIVYSSTDAKLPDVINTAQAPGFSVKFETNGPKITVIHKQQNLKWKLNGIPGYTMTTNGYQMTDRKMTNANPLMDAVAPRTDAWEWTHDDRGTEEKSRAALDFANYLVQTNIVLKMRTFEAAMYSVARQQVYFERLRGSGRGKVAYDRDDYGPVAKLPDLKLRVRPAMTLVRTHIKLRPERNLVEVNHANTIYSVGDVNGTDQNLLVFTIISYLYAQTSISTQNLPIQQVIRLQ